MSDKMPLSVFIIAKNEEDRIPYSIKSVIEWVDEVFVIDSGSTDSTVQISSKLGAKVLYNEWSGYGPQKVFGESLCRNNWILNIDADEEVSSQLRDEIKELFKTGSIDEHRMYRVDIKILHRFAKKPNKFTPSNNPVRLYNKNYAGFKDSTVHDSVISKDGNMKGIGVCKNIILHRCFRSISHAVNKINFYSTMQAEDMVSRGKVPTSFRIVFEPFFAFFKAYFLRRYFLLGMDGAVESFMYAFARTIRLAKTRELWKEKRAKQE